MPIGTVSGHPPLSESFHAPLLYLIPLHSVYQRYCISATPQSWSETFPAPCPQTSTEYHLVRGLIHHCCEADALTRFRPSSFTRIVRKIFLNTLLSVYPSSRMELSCWLCDISFSIPEASSLMTSTGFPLSVAIYTCDYLCAYVCRKV